MMVVVLMALNQRLRLARPNVFLFPSFIGLQNGQRLASLSNLDLCFPVFFNKARKENLFVDQ